MKKIITASELQRQIDALNARVTEQDEKLAKQTMLISKQQTLIKYYEGQLLLLIRKRLIFGRMSKALLMGLKITPEYFQN